MDAMVLIAAAKARRWFVEVIASPSPETGMWSGYARSAVEADRWATGLRDKGCEVRVTAPSGISA
jgi:hypothetical protein